MVVQADRFRSMRIAVPVLLAAVATSCVDGDPCLENANEPAYGGSGNDEVWLTMVDARDRATAGGDAPTITAPTDGQALPASEPPTISWDSPLKLALGPSAPLPLVRRQPGSLFDELSQVLIPSAHAHLPPVSSDAYLIDFLVPGRECAVSIVTTELSHTLDDDTWAKVTAAAGEIEMRLTSAYLQSGRITEGPFKASPISFTVH